MDGTPDIYVDKEGFNGSLDWTQRGPIVFYSASCQGPGWQHSGPCPMKRVRCVAGLDANTPAFGC